jgi:hypothetical protein
MVGLALLTLSTGLVLAVKAETVLSNETLVTTTFVVNKESSSARCAHAGCSAKTTIFSPIVVACPAPNGQTCTLHISLDAKTVVHLGGTGSGAGPTGFYQFLVDNVAPTIGPTDQHGDYLFEKWVTIEFGGAVPRQRYPASVLTTVTNSNSNDHTITASVGCRDIGDSGGCEATAQAATLRVDVFEP